MKINYYDAITEFYFLENKNEEEIKSKLEYINNYDNLDYWKNLDYIYDNDNDKIKFSKLIKTNINNINISFFKNFKQNFLKFLNDHKDKIKNKHMVYLDFFYEQEKNNIVYICCNKLEYYDSRKNSFKKDLLKECGVFDYHIETISKLFKSLHYSFNNYNCFNLIESYCNSHCYNCKNVNNQCSISENNLKIYRSNYKTELTNFLK